MNRIQAFEHTLSQLAPGIRLLRDVPMSRYTSFHIGGTVPLMAEPGTVGEAAACRKAALEAGLEPLWLGRGTNMLIEDGELSFPVIHMGEGLSSIERDRDTITVMCGAPMASAAVFARDCGLTGLEFAHGIPGSMGGGVYMNAGAYGGSLSDRVLWSTCLTPEGETVRLGAPEHGYGYRHSAFMDNGYIVLETALRLEPGDKDEITARMAELRQKRAASQPLDKPSAGSTFKRPVGGYAAALIEQAGLKGESVGGAMVSPKHSGFVVNNGGASFEDVIALMEHVRERVFESSGITLEPEVRIIDREGKPWTF